MAKAKKEEKRPAHRPHKYGEETVRINIRVPKSKKEALLNVVRAFLRKLEK